MNYIQQLKADVTANATLAMNLQEAIRELRVLALSDKHQGVDPDGDRKDWIASADILRWCDRALSI